MNTLEKQGYDDYNNNKPLDISLVDNYDYNTGYEIASIQDFLKNTLT